jgi:anti-sigma factor RsiW
LLYADGMVGALAAVGIEQRGGGVMDRLDPKSAVVFVLFIAVVVGAVAEVLASRVVPQPEAPRAASWQIVVRAGDAARVRGDAPAARRAYLAALSRARDEGSRTGVLRAAEGFKALGDAQMVEQALRTAALVGPEDRREHRGRLQALRDRLHAADALPITPVIAP